MRPSPADLIRSGLSAAPSATAYVGLGANLGDMRATLASATAALAATESTELVRSSALYRSASAGAPGPDYLNSVVELRTTLAPMALLGRMQRIEAAHGRERSHRNAPRTLDLDLLVYGDLQIATAELTLPHPRIAERAFVLRPLAEVAPRLRIAGLGAIGDLLAAVAAQPVDKL